MEAERIRSVKRKPLSDRTNLIPSGSGSHGKSFNYRKLHPHPKPYHSSTNKSDNNSSKSNISVGSSSNNNNGSTASDSAIISLSPHASIANPGTGNGELIETPVVCNRRQTVKVKKDQEKRLSVPSGFTLLCKTRDRRKLFDVPSSCLLDKFKDKGAPIAMHFSHHELQRAKDKRKVVVQPFSCPATQKKGKMVAVPSSCPPPRKTMKFRDKNNEAGDIGTSKSCTLHSKERKKRRRTIAGESASKYDLPQDFIEQQRAYFNEIDEFELPEEEVTDNELD